MNQELPTCRGGGEEGEGEEEEGKEEGEGREWEANLSKSVPNVHCLLDLIVGIYIEIFPNQ